MSTPGIIALVVVIVFLIVFGLVMFKIFTGNKQKEFDKKTDIKEGIAKNAIEDRKIEILSSIDPNDPEDAKKKLEVVKELDKLNKNK
ncbi:MAG: hypothetical protein MJ222_04185 [Bacilli bacterium]|nr:hypothetical protein [Bacilli bacterium]